MRLCTKYPFLALFSPMSPSHFFFCPSCFSFCLTHFFLCEFGDMLYGFNFSMPAYCDKLTYSVIYSFPLYALIWLQEEHNFLAAMRKTNLHSQQDSYSSEDGSKIHWIHSTCKPTSDILFVGYWDLILVLVEIRSDKR